MKKLTTLLAVLRFCLSACTSKNNVPRPEPTPEPTPTPPPYEYLCDLDTVNNPYHLTVKRENADSDGMWLIGVNPMTRREFIEYFKFEDPVCFYPCNSAYCDNHTNYNCNARLGEQVIDVATVGDYVLKSYYKNDVAAARYGSWRWYQFMNFVYWTQGMRRYYGTGYGQALPYAEYWSYQPFGDVSVVGDDRVLFYTVIDKDAGNTELYKFDSNTGTATRLGYLNQQISDKIVNDVHLIGAYQDFLLVSGQVEGDIGGVFMFSQDGKVVKQVCTYDLYFMGTSTGNIPISFDDMLFLYIKKDNVLYSVDTTNGALTPFLDFNSVKYTGFENPKITVGAHYRNSQHLIFEIKAEENANDNFNLLYLIYNVYTGEMRMAGQPMDTEPEKTQLQQIVTLTDDYVVLRVKDKMHSEFLHWFGYGVQSFDDFANGKTEFRPFEFE